MKSASYTDQGTRHPSPDPPLNQHEAIRRRAEEIYVRNGRMPGRDLENWTQAEQEILCELAERGVAAQHQRKTAIVVKVGDVQYVGEYSVDASEGYTPGEFSTGAPVPVRFHGNKMFVKRRNGRELETTIVNKVE